MPAANATLLDIHSFIAQQRAERYRAFVIHGPPLKGKSTFARRLAESEGGVYLDILSLVHEDTELSKSVDTLDAAWLEGQVRAAITGGANFVVVDEFDFLWPIWGNDIEPLLYRIERFYVEAPAVVVWVMPTHRALNDTVMPRANGVSRVLPLEGIKAL